MGPGNVECSDNTDFMEFLRWNRLQKLLPDYTSAADRVECHSETQEKLIMSISLPPISVGSTNWGETVNGYWAAIEGAINTRAAKICKTSTSSISNGGSPQLVPFANDAYTVEIFNTDSMYDKVNQPQRITIQTAGKYLCIGQVQWATNGTNARLVSLNVNGTERARSTGPGMSTMAANLCIAAVYDLAVSDYVQMLVYQDSGGYLNVNGSGSGGTGEQDFTVIRIGP